MASIVHHPRAEFSVSFSEALRFWFKLGFISFGGPAGQISIMHQELVERRRWISERRFLHALNYCMVLPGPEAQQLATYIGWLMHRTWGGIVAGALFVLPSFFILMALAWVYLEYGEISVVAGAFHGIKPAVTAIVVQAALRIGDRALRNAALWALAAAAFLAILAGAPFPAILICAALVGLAGGHVAPDLFRPPGRHGPTLDVESPTPGHVRFRWSRLARVTAVGFLCWAVPIALLAWTYGSTHTLTRMAWFFTKAALLTFGGAYAVLPYVYQGSVETFGWLSAAQMMDGLALGETTPGPLIMIVTFVGFVGGYQGALLGSEHLLAAGMLAALVVTWFTFLPSFVFILAGGPLVESTQGDLKFTAPLTAISAAVVGVIANLAAFFAYHVFWPRGFAGPVDSLSVVIALAALTALLRFQRGVIEVIVASAVVGCATSMLTAVML
jgi:chromate transporter